MVSVFAILLELLKPGEVDAAHLVLTCGDAKLASSAYRVQSAPNVASHGQRCKGFDLAHLHARKNSLLRHRKTASV